MKEKIFEELLDIVKNTKNFLKEEIPEIGRELLKIGFIYDMVLSLVVFLSFSIISVINYKFYYYIKTLDKYELDGHWCGFVLLCLIASILLVGFIFGVLECVKNKIAPRVYLIEKLNKYLDNSKR